MTLTNSEMDQSVMSATKMLNPELLEMARKKIEALLAVQKEMMQTLQGINHDLFDRAKKESDLASEFIGKLAAARTPSDATSTYHEWATREMELLAADGRQMFANIEKFIETSRRLFANGVHPGA